MSQWGQGAPGYQYPLQTGFPQQQQQQPQQFQQQNPTGFSPGGFQQQPNPGFGQPQQQQFFGGGGGGLQPQPTGFVPQRPLQGQPTGFIPQQQTGFIGSSFQARPPPPPVPPLPQFQQQQPPPPPPPIPQPSFLNQPPGGRFGGIGGGLTPQQTGYPGGQLVPQVTGFIDPRLQMLSSSFLPASSTPGGAPQLQPLGGGPSLQQSFRQHNEEVKGTAAPRVPWALSKGEKKSYDQIFRAWDASGSGFIDGQKAIQVFGQSGLSKDDLAKVWALADADNRGKLNVAEFHVAMGLIYRKLNGNEIPDVLPPELVPPSHRDLDEAVHFVRDLVKNDVRASSPSGTPASLLKVRSFTDREAAGAGSRQDATVYKHDESAAPLGGRYVPRSRHVDRDEVRGNREVRDATSDLDDLKRQLEGTASRLDAAADEREGRTREDDALDAELDDLRFRAKRLREDLDYLTRAPKTSANDEERRKLERQLLTLMHERLPDVERRVKDRQARREREKRERDRDRDRRNERFGRFGERDDDPYERRKWEREREERERDRDLDRRPYSRGGYDDDRDRDRRDDRDRPYSRAGDRDRPYSRTGDRDRPYSRGTYDDDRDRRDDRDRDRDRRDDRTPSAPPPPPPPAPSSTLSPTSSTLSPTSAGRSAVSPSPAPNLSSMTPAERAAYLKEQAAKKVRERMAALGVTPSPSSTPRVDTTVEDRLAQERKEAEDKTREAERAAEERERARRERLENEKALREGRAPAPAPSAPTLSKPTPPAPRPPPPAVPAGKKAPAPPPPRGVLKNASKPPAPAPPRASPAPPPPPPPAAPAVDPEEEALKQREAELKARREARRKQIEMEEEEERKADEARAEARRMREAERARAEEDARKRDEERARTRMDEEAKRKADEDARKKAEEDARKAAEEERARAAASAISPPPAPAPPPPPPAPPAPSGSSTNPFHRANGGAASAVPAAASPALNGGNNPFFRSQPSPAPPSAVSAPKGSYNTASRADADSEDDWGAEKDIDEDSSDDEVNVSRNARQNIAAQLFGSILPTRPQSAGPPGAGGSGGGTPTSALSPPPPPPSAPPAPVPPAAPPAPPPPSAISPSGPSAAAPPAAPGDRGALLSAIQGGARLRKAKTNDRSGSGLSGRVLGDTAPPPHINTQPIEREPPPTAAAIEIPPPPPPATNFSLPPVESPSEGLPPSFSMEAVDSKASNRQSVDWYAGLAADHGAVSREPSGLAPPTEEDEAEVPTPSIEVHASEPDLFEDIDKGVSKRVRTLYAYEGQRPEDLSFGENIVLVANPSKSGGEWWYGTAVRDGKAGFFPKLYVQEIDVVKAKAFYPYSGGSSDELPFAEGDVLDIVDRSESDWWKAEHAGAVFIVPAAYLEIIQG